MPRVAGSFARAVFQNSSDDEHAGRQPAEQDDRPMDTLFEKYYAAIGDEGDEDDVSSDQVFRRGLARVRDHLSASAAEGGACLICLSSIKPAEAVWSCQASCHVTTHLPCIQEWARSQVDLAVEKASTRLQSFPTQAVAAEVRAGAEWGCPKCRAPYPGSRLPSRYLCFCGKVAEPAWDPWIAPHSCGEICGKPLPGGCGHACLLLCHPGPCPPCPLLVDAACYCGRRHLKRRCGQHSFSCSAPCNKRQPCGHACPIPCHEGACGDCTQQGLHACRCGAERRAMACSVRDWQCARVCGKALSCGNHACDKVCHSGACGACPNEGARTCPCGKLTYEGLTCTDRAAPCGGTCGKLLACGMHRCMERCHVGECSKTCRAPVNKQCRCGASSKQLLCHQEFACEKRCNALRACGRHVCKRRCCDGSCAPCEETCNKRLKCGSHKCPAPCHSGPCRPCPITLPIPCACGRTSTTVPCGVQARTLPPKCVFSCPVPALCRHALKVQDQQQQQLQQQLRHRCHYGPCPGPCSDACGTIQACGHPCSSTTCHDPTPPPIPQYETPVPPKNIAFMASTTMQLLSQQRDKGDSGSDGDAKSVGPTPGQMASLAMAACQGGKESEERGRKSEGAGKSGAGQPQQFLQPAAAAAAVGPAEQARQFLASLHGGPPSACPPCPVPLTVYCLGQHTSSTMPCSTAHDWKCGRACGWPLACGNHTCSLPCHAVQHGEGEDAPIRMGRPCMEQPSPCEPCNHRCDVPRPGGCTHACPLACHPTSQPCPPCSQSIRTACHCGKTSLRLVCSTFEAFKAGRQQQGSQQQQHEDGAGTEPSASGTANGCSGSMQNDDMLCCGKPCHRQLPRCPHLCRASCHSGACPSPECCSEEVTVRCECKRLKARWACGRVQAELARQKGGKGIYDALTQLRLLPCDGECVAAKGGPGTAGSIGVQQAAAKFTSSTGPAAGSAALQRSIKQQQAAAGASSAAAGSSSSSGSASGSVSAAGQALLGLLSSLIAKAKAVIPTPSPSTPSRPRAVALPADSPADTSNTGAANAHLNGGGGGPRPSAVRLTRAEREAAAARAAAERTAREARSALIRRLVYVLVVVVGVLLGLGVKHLLEKADAKLQQRYSPKEL